MTDCTGRSNDGIYNCFGEMDDSMCFTCIHNADSESEEKTNCFVSQKDKVEVLHHFLTGYKQPDGVTGKMPKLNERMAFAVIWFLQEVLHCLPDNIAQCGKCLELYDSHSEGYYLDDQYKLNGNTLPKKYYGHYCSDKCAPDVEFELK